MAIDRFTVDERYVESLAPLPPHLFHNSKPGQANSRKFIGVLLKVAGLEYFAPLSSFKPKHRKMKNSLDFIKLGDLAVINLNCMFPVPRGVYHRVSIPDERDSRYRNLLRSEIRLIRRNEQRIMRNAEGIYRYKLSHDDNDRLAARCNDFAALEEACRKYINYTG